MRRPDADAPLERGPVCREELEDAIGLSVATPGIVESDAGGNDAESAVADWSAAESEEALDSASDAAHPASTAMTARNAMRMQRWVWSEVVVERAI